MKKILFLITQSEMGGAQRYIYEISKALSEKYEILVAAGEGDGELFQKLENTGVQPRYLKCLKRVPSPTSLISAIAEIARLLQNEKPDVLFLCSTTAGLLGSVASKIYKLKTKNPDFIEDLPMESRIHDSVGTRQSRDYQLKTIYRIGGWAFRDPRPFWKNWLVFWLEKLTACFKDLIIVNSEYDWRIAVEKKIVSPEKIVKIYNGIDIDSLDFLPLSDSRSRLSLSDFGSRLIVGCLANFYKTKGLEYLIEAFARPGLLGRPGLKLLIIGEGGERPRLENLIKKYGLEGKVILAGRVPDAYKYLKAFDVFALPSLKEGFPWVILEAAAAGIPIVATKVGAIPEILPEEFLVEPGDADDLAKKISRMLEHPAVPQLNQKFTLQRMVEETEKLL